MANLETLELTISANAESATQGIGHLIRSLSALSTAVGKSVGGLMKLNAELKTLKGYGNINLPGIGSATGAKAAVAKAKKAALDYDPAHNNGRGVDVSKLEFPSKVPDDVYNTKYKEAIDQMHREHEQRIADTAKYRQRIKEEAIAAAKYAEEQKNAYKQLLSQEKEAMNARGDDTRAIMEQSTKLDLLIMKQQALKMETISMAKEGKLTAKQIADRSMQYQKLTDEIQKTQDKLNETKDATSQLGEETKKSAKSMSSSLNEVKKSAGGLLSTIGRIFKTMLIRTAIRALLKAAKEGLDNYYQYSKAMGLEFASTMDKVHSKWNQVKNQLGAALGSALRAILPILSAIASAALVAFNALSALFALISGSDTYSQAIEIADDYADSINGAGKAAKSWLATFDELNVMTSSSGGGGVDIPDYSSMFQEVELPQWMVEWKPIIEAILGGVLGALILPQIFDWIKKILGLFGVGGGADTLLDILHNLFNNNNHFADLPDIAGAIAEMGLYAGAAELAAGAIETLKTKIIELKAALEGLSLISSLLELIISLVGSFVGGGFEIKIDDEEFKKWKEDFEKWMKENNTKTIKIEFDDTFNVEGNLLALWIKDTPTKYIKLAFEADAFQVVGTVLTVWIKDTPTKKIKLEFEADAFQAAGKILALWIADTPTKKIKLEFEADAFQVAGNLLAAWVNDTPTKTINIKLNNDTIATALLEAWINTEATKVVNISIKDDTAGKLALTTWLALEPTKTIKVAINDDAIIQVQKWIESIGEKTIKVKVIEDDGSNNNSGGGEGGGSDFFSDLIGDLIDWVENDPLWNVPIWQYVQDTPFFSSPLEENLPHNFDNEINLHLNTDYDETETKQTAEKLNNTIHSNVNGTITGALTYTASKIKEKAQGMDSTMRKYATGTVTGSLTYTASKIKAKAKAMKKVAVDNGTPTLKPDLKLTAAIAKDYKKNVNKKVVPDVETGLYTTQQEMNALENSIENGVDPTVEVNAKVKNIISIANDIADAISDAISRLDPAWWRSGRGLSTSSSKTISSVASGSVMLNSDATMRSIAESNDEQNALLRRQNELLYSILQKSGNVTISASSALGRVVDQSLAMYGSVKG